MRSMLCLFALLPVLVFAGNSVPITALPEENAVIKTENAQLPPATVRFLVGQVDTIGGTTYDWQFNGPEYRLLVNSSDYGLHAGWMFSTEPGSPWSDRNMRYNFYDYAGGAWNWLDPDFMASGVSVYTNRSGFGMLDADPVTGVAMFTAHQTPGGATIRPVLGRDMAPGGGIFEYCDGSPNAEGYQWPPIGIDANQVVHCALIDAATTDELYYTKVPTWCNWEAPVSIVAPQPQPMFPTQNIAASKISQKVCVVWVYSEGTPYEAAYYRISTDGGTTWGDATELTPPPAYGGDTIASFHITSLFPWYDDQDRLHIVAGIIPSVHDTLYIIPAEIWHWCPDNTPAWSKIHRAGCDPANLQASVGYNAAYACRPSIGQDDRGRLYVAWEQFDSANVEPVTNLLRADIFAAASEDGGNTWLSAVKLTEAGTASCRFPCVADKMVRLGGELYVPVIYEIDQQAGFIVQGQGSSTNNPFVVQWVPATALGVGIAEEQQQLPKRIEVRASPNPFMNRTTISYALPYNSNISLSIYDAAGRPVQTLVNGERQPGYYAVNFNANGLAKGVYFYTLTAGGTSISGKLTLVR
ncbi:MAG: T9SS type A sorting domain-containing protein [candidate division WOR-3 bacterium]|nr:T9SS type A sorting domain-containing protein [candidate division WOR-3 bacterium]